MTKNTIGKIITALRAEKKYSRNTLCQGLCSTQMLIKVEKDEADVDKFMVDILLQRLGKSPDKLEILLSDEEYEKVYLRDEIEELTWKKEKELALAKIEEYENICKKDSAIHQMYVYRSKANICHIIDSNFEEAEANIREAIRCTMPDICDANFYNYLLSSIEIENLLELALCQIEKGSMDEAQRLVEACKNYVDNNFTDEEEYAKIIGKIVWLRNKGLMEEYQYLRAYEETEKAINALRKAGIIYFMIPLLEQIVICCDQLAMDSSKWGIYLDTVTTVYHKYGQEWYCHDSLFHNFRQVCYHLIGEFIKEERKSKHITQEELIDGVYDLPVNLSRVENGKAAPTKNKLEGLMRNLGIEQGRYRGMLVVDNYDIYELRYELDVLCGTGQFDLAQNKIEELEKVLDTDISINRNVLELYQIMIDFYSKKIDEKEAYKKLKHMLEDSNLMKRDKIYRVPFYNELLALNMMSILLRRNGRGEEGFFILQNIKTVIDASKVDTKYQNAAFSLVLVNWNFYEKRKEIIDKGISYDLECGKGNFVYMYLVSYTDVIEAENAKQELTRLAFYMSDLFMRGENCQKIKDYYKETYNEVLV